MNDGITLEAITEDIQHQFNAEEYIDGVLLSEIIDDIINNRILIGPKPFNDNHRHILRSRHRIGGAEFRTYKQLAQDIGRTVERARQLHLEALNKIRTRFANNKKLREYLTIEHKDYIASVYRLHRY